VRTIKNRSVSTLQFDHIFDTDASQEDVYDLVRRKHLLLLCGDPHPCLLSTRSLCSTLTICSVAASVDAVLGGLNATIFAYGQTGTGKVMIKL